MRKISISIKLLFGILFCVFLTSCSTENVDETLEQNYVPYAEQIPESIGDFYLVQKISTKATAHPNTKELLPAQTMLNYRNNDMEFLTIKLIDMRESTKIFPLGKDKINLGDNVISFRNFSQKREYSWDVNKTRIFVDCYFDDESCREIVDVIAK